MPRGKGKAEEEKRVWAWEGSGWPGQGKDARLPGWAHPRSQPPAQLSGQPSSECEPNQTCLLGGGALTVHQGPTTSRPVTLREKTLLYSFYKMGKPRHKDRK